MSLELQGARAFLEAFVERFAAGAAQVERLAFELDTLDRLVAAFDQVEAEHAGGSPLFTFEQTMLDRAAVATQNTPTKTKPTPAKAAAARIPQAPAPTRPQDRKVTHAGPSDGVDALVLRVLVSASEPLPFCVLQARTKLTKSHLVASAKRLKVKKLLTVTGRARASRWAATPAAKTAAAKAPLKINGTEFEVVWADRKDDPSLLGARTQRAT